MVEVIIFVGIRKVIQMGEPHLTISVVVTSMQFLDFLNRKKICAKHVCSNLTIIFVKRKILFLDQQNILLNALTYYNYLLSEYWMPVY